MGETHTLVEITDIRGNKVSFMHKFLLIKNLNHDVFMGSDILSSEWVYAKTRNEIIFNKIPGKIYNTSKMKNNNNFVVIPISPGNPHLNIQHAERDKDNASLLYGVTLQNFKSRPENDFVHSKTQKDNFFTWTVQHDDPQDNTLPNTTTHQDFFISPYLQPEATLDNDFPTQQDMYDMGHIQHDILQDNTLPDTTTSHDPFTSPYPQPEANQDNDYPTQQDTHFSEPSQHDILQVNTLPDTSIAEQPDTTRHPNTHGDRKHLEMTPNEGKHSQSAHEQYINEVGRILNQYDVEQDEKGRIIKEAKDTGSFEIPISNYLKDNPRVQKIEMKDFDHYFKTPEELISLIEMDHLTPKCKEMMAECCKKLYPLFSKHVWDCGRIKDEAYVELNTEKQYTQKFYPIPTSVQPQVKEILDELKNQGVIRRIEKNEPCQFINCLLVGKRKNSNSVRIIADMRLTN